ncbi:hypothetical protein Drorol1_Dr00018097 [Drosera rotundifolia]
MGRLGNLGLTFLCVELKVSEEEENSWIFNADHMQAQALGLVFDVCFFFNLYQLEINDDRFEDAEEMEQDSSTGHQ